MKKIKALSLVSSVAMILSTLTFPVSATKETSVIFEEDFESYSSYEDLRSVFSSADSYYGWFTIEDGALVLPKCGNGLYLDRVFDITLNDVVSFDFDVKVPALAGYQFVSFDLFGEDLSNNTLTYHLAQFVPDEMNVGGIVGGEIAGNWTDDWYHVSVVYDCPARMQYTKLTDKNGTVLIERTDDYIITQKVATVNKIFGIRIGFVGNDYHFAFDNIRIAHSDYLPVTYNYDDGVPGYDLNIFSNWVDMSDEIDGTPTGADTERGKVFKFSVPNGGVGAYYIDFDEEYTTGKIGFKSKLRSGYGGSQYLSLRICGTGGTVEEWNPLLFWIDGTTSALGSDPMPVDPNKWYDVNCVVDLDAKTLDYEIVGEDGSRVYANGVDMSQRPTVNGFMWQINGSNGIPAYIDDIEITRNPKPIQEEIKVSFPVADDMEYSSMEAMKENWAFSNAAEALSSLETEDGNTYFRLGLSESTNDTMAAYSFQKVTTGKIKVSCDVKPGEGENYSTNVTLGGSAETMMLFMFVNGHVYTRNVVANYDTTWPCIGDYTPNKWYHCEAVIDIDNRKWEVSYEDIETGVINELDDIPVYFNLTPSYFAFQVWSHIDSSSCVDNLDIDYIIEKPTLTAGDISIINNDEVQTDLSKISPVSDKIVLDFHSVMSGASVSNAITVTNVTDGVEVEFEGRVDEEKYVIDLVDGLLPNKEYSISVDASAQNLRGAELGTVITLNFTTDSASYGAKLESLTQNGEAVSNLAGLTSNMAKVDVYYENSTGEAQDMVIIYGYYTGNVLKKAVCTTKNISADDKKGHIRDERVIEDLDGIDCVKVMLWDNFENIKPLSRNITLR